MGKRLTTKAIENAKPAASRREIPDGGSGLYLILQPSGHRSWALRYRFQGKPTKLTLGSWPALGLASARKAAADALHDLAQGENPAAAQAEAKIRAAAAKANTMTAVCEEYLAREGRKLRTVDQRVSTLRRLVYPIMGNRPIGSIKRSEVIRLLDKIEDDNGPRMAEVTLGVLRVIFNWHALRTDDFASPIVRGMRRINAKERARIRILDDAELRAVWKAAESTPSPFGMLVRFLLLTAARRTEAAVMCWDEIDSDRVWTLPARRSKTKVDVPRPLSKAAQAILEARPRFEGCPYVFTTDGLGPITNFSGGKAAFDLACGVTGWRLHDLRRTARSLLSRAGISPDVAERCLGHAIPGVRGIYDRHRYIEEMHDAFEALGALIERLIEPTDKVVQMPARR